MTEKRQGWHLYHRQVQAVVDPLQLRPDPDNPGKHLLYPMGCFKIRPRPKFEGTVQIPEGSIYLPDHLRKCPNCGSSNLDNEVFESPAYVFVPSRLAMWCPKCGWKGTASWVLDFNNAKPDEEYPYYEESTT